jgi:FKBP-type peptidyl-prolyl cis-trans isomerase 2
MTTPEAVPLVGHENWIDHEFLLHNEHVKVIGPNTVSISGPGITKKILRPGTGSYPLPKALVNVHIVGRIHDTGEIFQDTRDPAVQAQFLAAKQLVTRTKQLEERTEKCQKELDAAKDKGADQVDLDVIIARQAKEEKEAIEQNDAADAVDTRADLYIQQNSFQLGQKTVVRGLELAIQTMKVGEIGLVTCRPEYAYSDIGIGDIIPDNAVIDYEVELMDTEAGAIEVFPGILKKYIRRGEGWSSPQYNTTCDIYVEGSYAIDDGKVEEKEQDDEAVINQIGNYKTKQFLKRTEHPVQCRIDDILLPQGIEECLKTMKRGEIALFEVSKNILLGDGFEKKRHCSQLNIPPVPSSKPLPDGQEHPPYNDLIVYYYIELVELHHNVELWSLPLEQRITESERVKDVANEFLRLGLQNNQVIDVLPEYSLKAQLGHFSRSITRYRDCLDLYEHFAEYEQKQCTYDMISRVIGVQLACYNNLQVIYMKLKHYRDCDAVATKAIELFMLPFDIYRHDPITEVKKGDKSIVNTEVITPPINPGQGIPKSQREGVAAAAPESSLVSNLAPILNKEETEVLFKDNQHVDKTLPLYGEDVDHPAEPEVGPRLPGEDEEEEPAVVNGIPQLGKRAVLVGKTFPKQTNTNNLFKTLYRKAQALVLLGDEEGAKHYITLCQQIWAEKPLFLEWHGSVKDQLESATTDPKDDDDVANHNAKLRNLPQYKSQPILMYNILPLALANENNIDNLFPICFDTVSEDIKKEVDKLQVIVDKKLKAATQRSKAQWAKAFGNDD